MFTPYIDFFLNNQLVKVTLVKSDKRRDNMPHAHTNIRAQYHVLYKTRLGTKAKLTSVLVTRSKLCFGYQLIFKVVHLVAVTISLKLAAERPSGLKLAA